MKKKIAVFANGWSNEYLELVLEGIRKGAAERNADLFVFVNYSSGLDGSPDNIGESSIFKLPNLKKFDGVVLVTNTINLLSERQYLTQAVQKAGVPAVSLEYELPNIPYLGTDNYEGFYSVVEHLIQEHGVKKITFVSGPKDNEESNTRLRATKDAMQAAGLKLDADYLIDAGWSYYIAYGRCGTWLDEHDELPDAFVCANDEMAMGICTVLEQRNIAIPQQVIVTGCDYSVKGQEVCPMLTTVARHWEHLGYGSMRQLLDRIDGKEVSMKKIFRSEMIIGESCGCPVSRERIEYRQGAIKRIYQKQHENNKNEWHLRYVDEELAKRHSVEEFKKSLRGNLVYDHQYEGDNLVLCLVDDYFADDETRIINPGQFTRNMEVYVNLKDGKPVENKIFPTRQLLPDYVEDEAASHIYIFTPLHVGEACSGYFVQKDTVNGLYDQTLYTWTRHIGHDIERVRQNVRMGELNRKLKEISITDGLTGLKNRTGCDTLAIPYLQKCQREGKTSAIVFADVNRMKLINDKYGHLMGDLALCTVAEAIKKTLPKNWIAVRYGGDEFFMVGSCEDTAEAEGIKERLANTLEELKQQKKLIFPLTASFGVVIMHPGENYSVEEYLRKADEAMYETKQKYHASEAK